MKAEALAEPVNQEVIGHGKRVSVHLLAHLEGDWQDLGEAESGTVVGSHTLSPEATGIYTILPDRYLPLGHERAIGHPTLVHHEQPFWHQLDETTMIQLQHRVVPEAPTS